MKLKEKPRLELHYESDNIVIPCEKGQAHELNELLGNLNIDLEKDYSIEIKVIRQRRSLDANAYYFKLCRECAYEKGISLTELHNKNLANIGIAWEDNDGHKHWVLQKDDDWWLKQNEVHFAPTDRTESRNGVVYRWFYLLKPSHLFNTKEMSILIDYIIQDAKSLGIETLTPFEAERMKQLWGQNDGRP